ncbi:ABC transporter ATP-binding protein [Skermania piniformis]|uniref:ABC transporter ATP-binding protein/permease n=1 Tax=Skermania pinensis TaxID=39122 RepID=A0ABX8SCS6_9ACTN|nr:ABC transporter ATP-binding protein [Skermania piniformis]QXQ14405.1 ABC transporter ATP-binding protein/permease [Skermania piniformis]
MDDSRSGRPDSARAPASDLVPDRVALRARYKREAAAAKQVLAPVQGSLRLATLLTVLASVAAVVPFILIAAGCAALLDDEFDRAKRLIVVAFVILALRGLLQAGASILAHLVDARFQLDLRRGIAAKLTRVPLGWFTERSSTEVRGFLQDDVQGLHYLVSHARLDSTAALTVPLVTLIYLFVVDWRPALITLLPLIGYAFALRAMMNPQSQDRLARFDRREHDVAVATTEFVDGIAVVRGFAGGRRTSAAYQDAVDEYAAALQAWKGPMMRIQAASDLLLTPTLLTLVVTAAGLGLTQLGWLAPADLVAFLLVAPALGASFLAIGYGTQAVRQGNAAAARLRDLQQLPELAAPGAGDAELRPGPDVRFEGVEFGYRRGRPVLHDIDLTLIPGTVTALVGPSGAGKSTLAQLVPRFFDPTAGRIMIGGRDLRDYPVAELYRTVGFVLQDVRLIRGTVRENLALADPDAADAALERVARAARIHDRILALPQGYDTVLGEGAVLSGGEAQRLSIARALLADPPVLVLDEATAFADPESEAAVQDAVAELIAGRTVLVIAHRLHTITGVDRIVVLDGGTIVESGTHAELVEADGLYRRLWSANQNALQEVR